MISRGSLLIAYIVATGLVAGWAIYQRLAPRKATPLTQSAQKPFWAYWSWRIYASAVYLTIAYLIAEAAIRRDERSFLLVGIAAPFFLVVVVAQFTSLMFTFDYSVFGKYRRMPFPNETPLRAIPFSYAIIGRVRTGPLVTWELYRLGLGIRISTIGDVYLPLDEIDAIEIAGGFMRLTSALVHHCPEVRSPIGVPNRVAGIMVAYYPSKAPVQAELA
jgi:hypothetical protein